MPSMARMVLLIAGLAGPAHAQGENEAATNPPAQAEVAELPGKAVSATPFAGGTLSVRAIDGEKAVFFNGSEIARDLSAQLLRQFNVGGAPVALYAMGANGKSSAPCNGFLLIVWRDPQGLVQARTPPFICGTDGPAITSDALYFFSDAIAPGQVNPMVRWTADRGFSIAANLSFAPVPGSGWDRLEDSNLSVRQLMMNAAVYAQATATLGDQLYGVVQALENRSTVSRPEPGIHVVEGCAPNQCEQVQALGVIDGVHQGTFFAARVNGQIAKVWPGLEAWPPRAREVYETFAGTGDESAVKPNPGDKTGAEGTAAKAADEAERADEEAAEDSPAPPDTSQ